eukprot:TRINITY_DN106058_c0_g1_i1.p1 TRINITY_DN106058_c0_g1~~TRINITY_DN106058_c0_g1_i1.p1  ORF type:complete len:232 (+),score=33.21 TRINITY_DN106058_c0_g1_i1:42-698(+)
MEFKTCLRWIKRILRLLGALASLGFAAQGIWLLVNPDIKDFWEGCHWLGQGLLGVIVGAFGTYFEVKGGMSNVTRHFKSFVLNRVVLSFFYFWLGCYVMGGMGVIHTSEGWKVAAHNIGIIAWVVAVGDLLTACCYDPTAIDEKELNASKGQDNSPSEAPSSTTFGQTFATDSPSSPTRRCQAESAVDLEDVELAGAAAGAKPSGGGWASMDKPFGSA